MNEMPASPCSCRSGFSRDAFATPNQKHRGFRRSHGTARACAAFLLRSATRIALLFAATFVLAHTATAGPFPDQVSQGALVRAIVNPHAKVRVAGRVLRVGPRGQIVFGVGRDEHGPVTIEITERDGQRERVAIPVMPRDWPIERIEGVPPKTVEPPPEIAERIKREQARVVAARERDDAREDYSQAFAWPVDGRISGRFGNQRIYVVDGKDVPKSPHSGMDIAVPQGTPVKAPAAGVVTFADPDLYLTGGTVLVDHGHGVSSNFLHLSRIDVKVGQRVAQGDVIGAAGMTGRATGPHVHWGMNWFDVRVDPLLLLEPTH
jgi:murein DD-endopeptidase MepM/ murein hydrolase activator NlpD